MQHSGDSSANHSSIASPIFIGEAGREQHGTRVRFALKVLGDRLIEMRYRAYGCPYTLATCEWLARQLEGRYLKLLTALSSELRCIMADTDTGGTNMARPWLSIGGPLLWAQLLGVPAAKMGRLLVVEDALRDALSNAALSADTLMTKPL